jgi:NTP pyrophosphatase (non-canonical NTP hydrolase)
MEIQKAQQLVSSTIKKLDGKNGTNHDKNNTFVHLIEEVGELATQIFNINAGREGFRQELLESGICDCITNLLYLGSLYRIDVEKAMIRKYEKVKKQLEN